MKTIIKIQLVTIIVMLIGILSAQAVRASNWNNANTTKTVGTTTASTFAAGCSFKEHVQGSMNYDTATNKWSVSTPAKIKIRSRGASTNNIVVTSNGLYTTNGSTTTTVGDNAVTVNYNGGIGSSVTVDNNSSAVVNVDNTSITIGNVQRPKGATKMTVSIGGEFTVSDDVEDDMDNSTTYEIVHTVTCYQ